MSLYPTKNDQVINKAILELNGADLKVFLAIWTNRLDFGTAASFIATRTGLALNTVKKSLRILKEAGWIVTYDRINISGRSANCYDLHYSIKRSLNIVQEEEQSVCDIGISML